MTMTLIVVCCMCKKEMKRSLIKKMPLMIDPMISHSYCPSCLEIAIKETNEEDLQKPFGQG